MQYPKICKLHKFETMNKKSWTNHIRLHRGQTNKGKTYNNGENHGMWKGKDVGRGALHDYIKYHFPMPKLCNNCNQEKKLDIANISQQYKRDISDWEWLCRRCHQIKDGRWLKFRQNRIYFKEEELYGQI